jgi:hypothetical protein
MASECGTTYACGDITTTGRAADVEELMSEKARATVLKSTGHLLEPGESVICSVPNRGVPRWARLLGGGVLTFPYSIQKTSVALITERNVYVLKLPFTRATKILLKAPLGTVDASVQSGGSGGLRLVLDGQTIWLFGPKFEARARAIAAAASGRTEQSSEE